METEGLLRQSLLPLDSKTVCTLGRNAVPEKKLGREKKLAPGPFPPEKIHWLSSRVIINGIKVRRDSLVRASWPFSVFRSTQFRKRLGYLGNLFFFLVPVNLSGTVHQLELCIFSLKVATIIATLLLGGNAYSSTSRRGIPRVNRHFENRPGEDNGDEFGYQNSVVPLPNTIYP